METSSFKELEPAWQGHLRWLHDDYFYRRHSELWSRRALESLPPLMRATDMLVCGEDLGMVPDCVHPVLRRLGLLGTGPPLGRSHDLARPLSMKLSSRKSAAAPSLSLAATSQAVALSQRSFDDSMQTRNVCWVPSATPSVCDVP